MLIIFFPSTSPPDLVPIAIHPQNKFYLKNKQKHNRKYNPTNQGNKIKPYQKGEKTNKKTNTKKF